MTPPTCTCCDKPSRFTWRDKPLCGGCYEAVAYGPRRSLHCDGCGRPPALGCTCAANRREIVAGERRKQEEGW